MEPGRPTQDAMGGPLRRLLRPLVRLMVRCGVTFPAAADLLRGLYLEVAAQELGAARTDSRVSLMTGVHRKEIRRQRSAAPDGPPPALVSRNGQLIATWLGAEGYSSPDGTPLPLPRTAAKGPSFERLVTMVTRDVRPRTVLDDWLSQGIVTLEPDDHVRLSVAAFLPQPGQEEQLFYFARNLHDHLAAASANILASGAAPFIDRSVHYDGLTPEAAAALEQYGRAAAQRVLQDVNRRALALATEAPPGTATWRVNFGLYLLKEPDPGSGDGVAPPGETA